MLHQHQPISVVCHLSYFQEYSVTLQRTHTLTEARFQLMAMHAVFLSIVYIKSQATSSKK